MVCSCFVHTTLIIGTVVVAAGGLILAVEKWQREGQRREQHRLMRNVEEEHVGP
jgi:hypothetical protein